MKYQLCSGLLMLGFSVGLNASALATDAAFCIHCVSPAAAERAAQYYAPELKCESALPGEVMTPANQVCTSEPKRLVLAYPASRTLYTYTLERAQKPPYHLTIQAASLTKNEQADYLVAVDFYNKLSNAVSYAQLQIDLQGDAFISQSAAQNEALQVSGGECPKDTAFSVLVDPDQMELLESDITHLIKKGTFGAIDNFLQQGTKLTGVGKSSSGFDISVSRDLISQIPTAIVTFKASEQPSRYGVPDALIFDINLVGQTPQGDIVVSYKLSDASKIADISLGDWKGQDGSVPKISNACVLKQLANLKNTGGDFRKPDGTPSTFGEPDWVEPGVDDASLQRCTVHFFQAGALLYAFQVSARQC